MIVVNIFEDLTAHPEWQETLINKTTNSELVLKYPVQTTYQKTFLKELIKNLENKGTIIHDLLYSAYGRLVALPIRSEYYKHYRGGARGNVITLRESINLISNGTTGLRTWQASTVLSEWIIQNNESFRNKIVLELGSGVGLTGLVLATESSPKCVYLTDCHHMVLQALCENVKLNATRNSVCVNSNESLNIIQNRCLYHLGPPKLSVLNLPWEDIDERLCKGLGTIDKVIAADVVYDIDLFDALISALNNLSIFCGVKEFIFACTERNPITLQTFIEKIDKAAFSKEVLDVPEQKHLLWPSDSFVKLFRFTR